ncbi:hypothetical protein Tco_0340185 [Tanacetum coccineum]
MRGNRQRVQFEFFINNDLKYLQGGVSTITYTTSTTKTKAAQYDLPGIEDMVMRKHGHRYLEEIVVRRADNVLYRFKEGDDVADFAIALRMFTRSLIPQDQILEKGTRKKKKILPRTKTLKDFIYVDDYKRNRLIRSDELYKFSDGTLTRLLSSLEDITKNIDMEYFRREDIAHWKKDKSSFNYQDNSTSLQRGNGGR